LWTFFMNRQALQLMIGWSIIFDLIWNWLICTDQESPLKVAETRLKKRTQALEYFFKIYLFQNLFQKRMINHKKTKISNIDQFWKKSIILLSVRKRLFLKVSKFLQNQKYSNYDLRDQRLKLVTTLHILNL